MAADGWIWQIDNNLDCYGLADDKRKVVRINVERHAKDNEDLFDTFVHEHLHVRFPKLSERKVRELTEHIIDFLPSSVKWMMEMRYMRRLRSGGVYVPPATKKKRRKR